MNVVASVARTDTCCGLASPLAGEPGKGDAGKDHVRDRSQMCPDLVAPARDRHSTAIAPRAVLLGVDLAGGQEHPLR